MAIPIQFRKGTAAEWAGADPVLFEGELGLLLSDDPDTQLMKIGDGVLKWSELPWALRGPRGYDFIYQWDGTTLQVKHSDEDDFTEVDLGIHFTWDGTSLGVKRGTDEEYIYADLRGANFEFAWEGTTLKVKTSDQDDYQEVGLGLQFNWDGTQLGIKRDEDAEYSYINLKGDKGDQGDKGDTGNPGDLAEGKIWVGNAEGMAEEADFPNQLATNSQDGYATAEHITLLESALQTPETPTKGGVLVGIEVLVPNIDPIKSVVFDFEDNWGASSEMGMKSIDFYWDDALIPMTVYNTDFVTYPAEVSYEQNYAPRWAFMTNIPIDGGMGAHEHFRVSESGNYRIIIVFTTPQLLNKISIENLWGLYSDYTTAGVKNAKIYTSSDTITSLTYGETVPNSSMIFDGVFNQHSREDVSEPQVLSLIQPTLSVVHYGEQSGDELRSNLGVNTDSLAEGKIWVGNSEGVAEEADVPSSEYLLEGGIFVGVGVDVALPITVYTAKSVVFDIADNYGGSRIQIKAIHFYLNDVLITKLTSDFTAYATTIFLGTCLPSRVFDTSLPTIGSDSSDWISTTNTNQRLVCVFNTEIEFDSIHIVNGNNMGTNSNFGAQNVKIKISDDVITSTIYDEAITNSELLFDGIFNQHSSLNEEDAQILLSGATERIISPIEEPLIRHTTKAVTSTLTPKEMLNNIIDNYGQSADSVLTLPTPGPLMATIFQISNADNDLRLKLGVDDTGFLDGEALSAGAEIHVANPVVSDFVTLWTIKTGATTWEWMMVSGPNAWEVVA